ncbi:hypothetical protein Hypma_003254 [Hypsizygus marmoreus]|uniref:Uncharacterized protein n=1 Tax=Hypsizygus marmoreus TaxID=39966 RepID=A0A369K143_HYPMA|nr:hypothetical protein Hypma_003254 [Hypsizygus marmoreus]
MSSTLPKPYISSRLVQQLLLTVIILCTISLSLTPFKLQSSIISQPRTSRLWPRELNITSRVTSSICTNPPLDNCAFYADCLESQYHCGEAGYPIGYGEHFCEKFGAQRGELSERGQSWMLNTMHCLQTQLVPEATGATVGVTCDSLEKKAFESHAGCYVKNGLCTLPLTDWLAIVHIVGLKTLFESKEAFLATLEAEKGCLKAYLFFLGDLIF